MEAKIKASLVLLLEAIQRSDGPAVAAEMARLDYFLEENRGELAAQLAHFLERRSYAKALVLLGGEAPAAGSCGGKAR